MTHSRRFLLDLALGVVIMILLALAVILGVRFVPTSILAFIGAVHVAIYLCWGVAHFAEPLFDRLRATRR